MRWAVHSLPCCQGAPLQGRSLCRPAAERRRTGGGGARRASANERVSESGRVRARPSAVRAAVVPFPPDGLVLRKQSLGEGEESKSGLLRARLSPKTSVAARPHSRCGTPGAEFIDRAWLRQGEPCWVLLQSLADRSLPNASHRWLARLDAQTHLGMLGQTQHSRARQEQEVSPRRFR